jgi:(E)-4-hydroxy-3-methylbut-2-enyl-diphosphate synthase
MSINFQALKPCRHTRVVQVGNLALGGNNEIRVQTMLNTDTLNIKTSVKQAIACIKSGAELIRLTTPTPKHAEALGEIKKQLLKKGYQTPLIADVHFLPAAAYKALEFADKIRLNPGNLFEQNFYTTSKLSAKQYQKALIQLEENLTPFIQAARKAKKPLRIGTNHGSLSPRILNRYGNTPRGMVEATMEYLRIFKKHRFHELVVALKAADPLVMIEANRLLVHAMNQEKMNYPLHLGVTEAGNAAEGRAKSTIGIGTLLLEGIGDTIRVSLTEDPANEPPEAYNILQACHRRITKTEFISCPSCGRTLFDIAQVTNKIKAKLANYPGLRIAIMGCIVNGPGEMAEADYGYVGGSLGKINLYQGKKLVKKNIPEKEAIGELVKLIENREQKSSFDIPNNTPSPVPLL